jgi:eukaryotic-like serine/threonine-protein kinase
LTAVNEPACTIGEPQNCLIEEYLMNQKIIANYRIDSEIGRGGMGVVYRAHDMKLNRDVALKFLPHGMSAGADDRERLLQEARAAAGLNHPNICTVHDIGEADGEPFIVMELVEGKTLREVIREGVLPIATAISYGAQIGEALAAAHSRGIVHRDVKSENMMVTRQGQIKVMDFGLAKLKETPGLTRGASTVGTAAYMSPEQIQGGSVDARSDLFSLGVVLFEMLTGQLPFHGEHDAALLYSIVNTEPESLVALRSDVAADLERIVARALEKDPGDRFQSAADLVSELRRLQKGRSSTRSIPVQPVPTARPSGEHPAMPSGNVVLPSAVSSRKKFVPVIVGIVIVAVAVAAYFLFGRGHSAADSLAVLPFVNTGTDAGSDYLSDGMTESIINSLTRLPNVRVVPRSTVFRFKGKDVDPQEIGKQLHVSTILTGTVVQRGNEMTVQVDLIDVTNQSQIWGDRLTRSMDQIMTLQDEIVSSVTREMKLAVSSDAARDLTRHNTSNPEAYKLYLQGRYYWNKRRGPDIEKGIDYYRQALALDPSYALAWLGLAESYLLQEQYEGIPASECYPNAETALNKALAVDPNLGEAHAAMGFVKGYNHDWAGAEAEYRKAIELNPQYATSYHWYSILLHGLGRHEEAGTMIEKARQLDPLSPVIAVNTGLQYFYTGDPQKAERELKKALDLDASFAPAHVMLGRVYVREGNYQDGEKEIQQGIALSGGTPETFATLAYCEGKSGKVRQADSLIAMLKEKYGTHRAGAYNVALAYAGTGRNDSALTWLERDFRDHSGWALRMKEFEFEPLFKDPRYIQLLKESGIEK